MHKLLLPALLTLLCGCGSLPSQYVAADRAMHNEVAPAHRRYVEEDASLDEDQKARRFRLLDAWESRVTEGER